ncbi:hypothetical protein BG000_006534 [Podila horticola]|nr:hypothetical protein BG000_006534 [Podila horticola]
MVVTFSTTAAILVPSEPASSPSSSISSISHEYPGTINAKMVKEHSDKQNLEGLKHALRAAIEKSSAAKQSGRLFNGGILTSANHKKWYHSSMPINWIQKISSEYHFGNYVIIDRKTSATSWEDMPIYARIGMHLIFSCVLDHKLLRSSKIRKLFSVESVNQGKHFDAPESVAQIPHFIKAYNLDLSELLLPNIDQYTSFNQFFYRKLRPDTRPIHEVDNPNIIVSAADCRFCVFESISVATQVWIKGKAFSVQNLVNDDALAAEFEGGSIGIFRLAPQDYHRFHSPVQGTVAADPTKIPGTYFTVNPMAVNDCVDVFTENVRKVSVLDLDQSEEGRSKQFDKCVFVSIGALLVGSIELTGAGAAGNKIKKGDELGYFAYGGSTCILLFKKDAVKFDQDLVTTSLRGVETLTRATPKALPRVTEEVILDDNQYLDYPFPRTELTISTNDDPANEPYDSDVDQDQGWCASSKATLQEGQILKSGYLMKKGERIKEYELLRIIDIRDVHRAAEVTVKHKSHVFVILTPRRTFTVQAKNHIEMQEWISAINQAKVQLEFTSSSDLDSYSGSTLQLNEQLVNGSKDTGPGAVESNPSLSSRLSRPGLAKLGSGIVLARRHHPVTNKIPTDSTDASTTSSNKTSQLKGKATSTSSTDNDKPTNAKVGITNKKKKNIPAPLFMTPPPSKQLQETTEILNTPTASPRRCSNALFPLQRIEDMLANTSTAPMTLPSPPPSVITTAAAKMDSRSDAPSSPGYYSGGEEVFWTTTATGEHMSSGEDEIQEEDENDPCFLEAGRVASEANAPGSGLVSAEELGSKVVRQGYLLKLGNKYKTWRKKWFVLRGDKLTYYKNTKEYQPHGIIPLSTVIDCLQTDPVSKSKQYCLRIVTTKRSFLCSAPDEDTLLQWLDALHVECDRVARERELESTNPSTIDVSKITAPEDTNTTTSGGFGISIPSLVRARSRSKSGEPLGSYGGGNNNNTTLFSSSIPGSSLGRSGSQLRKITSLDSSGPQHASSMVTFQLPHASMSNPLPPLPPAAATVTFSA